MEINQDYMHFKRWYKDTESAIHCGQWDDEQIAYAAYCEGMKRVKTCNKPAVSVACTGCSLDNSYFDGTCNEYRCLDCHEIIEVHER